MCATAQVVEQALVLLCNSLENRDPELWAVAMRRELMALAARALSAHPTAYSIQHRGLHLFAQLLTRGEHPLVSLRTHPTAYIIHRRGLHLFAQLLTRGEHPLV